MSSYKWPSVFSSPLTTKGDLLTFSSLAARLPVGTNGQVLSADSAEPTGLKWIAAGGGGLAIGAAITGGTANRILLEGAGNTLAESASLTFDGTTLTGPTNLNLSTGAIQTIKALGTTMMELRPGFTYIDTLNNSIIASTGTARFGRDSGAGMYPFETAWFGTGGVAIGTVSGGAAFLPNYELDIRGGAGSATIQLSTNASGGTPTDGVKLDFDGIDLKITNQEGGKLLVSGALGVGNTAAATTPGAVVRKMEIFSATGVSLGFIPVYDAIT
jgi:hypothetical protein